MHLEPEQTPVIVFYPVRLSVRLSELFLSLSHKHHLGVSQGRIFTFLPLHGSATYAAQATETVEKVTDEAKTFLSK